MNIKTRENWKYEKNTGKDKSPIFIEQITAVDSIRKRIIFKPLTIPVTIIFPKHWFSPRIIREY